jgi:hypothetical protein
MPFGTNYLRMKADECRVLAAATDDGSNPSKLLNMAEHYDREAEPIELQLRSSVEKATMSR